MITTLTRNVFVRFKFFKSLLACFFTVASFGSAQAFDSKQVMTITTQVTHNACANGKDGSIDISISGGLAPYTFLWSTGATTEDLLFVESGTFTVTVTDDAGVIEIATATITEPTPVVINLINLNNVTCFSAGNGSINISPSGGVSPYTYLWNNGATVEDRVSLAPGLYTVLVTDDNGCSTNATYQITGPSLLTCNVSTIKAISCFGSSDGSAIINTNSGGTQPYTYTWSNGQTTQIATGLSAGLTLVTVTDANNCNSICGVNMQQPVLLAVNYTQTNVSTTGGSNGAIDVTVSGGSQPFTYLWNDGVTTQDRNNLIADTYILTVTDVKQCTKTISVIITQPNPTVIASASGTNPTCAGNTNGTITSSATGGSIPYTYLWSTGSTNQTVVNVPAGTYTITVTDNGGSTSTAIVTLSDPPVLQLNATILNPLCFGGNDGSIAITAIGGTAPYSIVWLSGSNNFIIQNLVSGDYTCTVTDAAGCSVTETYFLPDNPILTCSASVVTDISCFGNGDGEAIIQPIGGSPGYTFIWSDGQTTINALSLVHGNYTATVTDSKGCTTTCQVAIVQPAALSLNESHTDVTISGGNDGTITTTTSGGTAPFIYLWSDGSTTSNKTGLISGTYTVTVADFHGCTASVVVFISQPGTLPVVFLTTTNVSCGGQSTGQINASVLGGVSPYTYLWSNGNTNANNQNLVANTYTVTVTDATGATVSGQSTVTEPFLLNIFVLQVTDNVCGNGSAGAIDIDGDGGTQPYTFLWSNGSVAEDIINSNAGTYTVTMTDASGCTVTASATIAAPVAISANINVTDVTCNGLANGSLQCIATGGTAPLTYAWSNGSATSQITSLVANTYTVTVADAVGCTMEQSVIVAQPNVLIVNETHADLSAIGANDGVINIQANGGVVPYIFLWNDGTTLEDRNNLPAAIYTVTVIDANGCSTSASIEISDPTCSISLAETHSNVTVPGGSDGLIDVAVNGAIGNVTYLWNDGATTEDRTSLTAGTYTVLANDALNCSASITIVITAPTCNLGLNANQTNVTLPNGNDGSIQLVTTGGVSPISFQWNDGSTLQNRNNLIAGTYTVTVTDDNNCTTSTIINITQPACAISVSETHNNVSIPNGNDGSIDVTVTGAFAPVSFIWNDGSTNEDRNNLSAGAYTVTATDAGNCSSQISITINQPACAISVSETHNNVSIPNGNDGSIDVTVTGAFAPVSFIWNDGSTNEDRNNLSAGAYTVTATDAGNCSSQISITINQPGCGISVSETHNNVSIPNGNDGSIDVTVTGAFAPVSFIWNDGSTNEDRNNLSAGAYTVTATDAGNCSSQISITINQPACVISVSETHNNVSIPNGNDGSIDVTVTGAFAPVSFIWNDGSTNEDRNNLSAGAYTVTATDAGNCSSQISITINQPVCAISVSETHNNVSIPNGNDGSIDVTVTGAFAPVSFIWNDGSTNEDRNNLSSGAYTVTATDAGNCSSQISITINQPGCVLVVNQNHTDVSYPSGNDGSITLTVSGAFNPVTFIWSDGNTNQNRNNLTASTYTVTVSDAGGCVATKQIAISQPACALQLSTTHTNVSIPNGSDGTINTSITGAFNPVAFIWSDGVTTQNRTLLSAGTYTVTATDMGNCTSEETIIISAPVCGITVNGTVSHASIAGGSDGSILLTFGNNYGQVTFLWSNGSTNQDLINIGAATYTVTVTDAANCTATYQATVTQPACALSLSYNITHVSIANGNDGSVDVTATNGFGTLTYLWNDGTTTEDRINLTQGTYTVTVTDAANCQASETMLVTAPACALLLTQNHTDVSVPNGSDGSIDIIQSGGFAPVSYLWNDGETTEDRNNLVAGNYTVIATDAGNCTASKQITISQPLCALLLSSTSSNVSTPGGSDGSITINQTGAFLPISYLWNDGSTVSAINNLVSGTYTVTATDAGSCSASLSVTITEPTCNITLAGSIIHVTQPNGADGSVTTQVNGAFGNVTYLWSNGVTTANIVSVTAGIYTVTVTDAANCTAQNVFVLNQPSCSIQITETHTDVSLPAGVDGTIDVTSIGQFGAVSYIWNDGNTNEDRQSLSAGAYTVTATDAANCTTSKQIVITQPACSISTSFTQNNVSVPNGTDGSIDMNVNGAFAPISFIWNDGNTNEDRSTLSAGTYTVTVTDAGNCTSEQTVIITQPACQLSVSENHVDVSSPGGNDGSISLNVTNAIGNVSFIWNDGITTQDRTNVSAGTYTVTATDSVGCSQSVTVTINQPGCSILLSETHVDVSIPNANNGSIDIVVTGSFGKVDYIWNDGVTTQDRNNLYAGTYTLTANDASNCIANINITIIAPPCALLLTQNHSDVTIPNGSDGSINTSQTGGFQPITYQWSDGETTEDRANLMAGFYTVTATDAGGCTSSKQITITQPMCALGLSEVHTDVTQPNGNDGTIDITTSGAFAPVLYLWSDGVTTQDRTLLVANTYVVTATDAGNCTSSQMITIVAPPCNILLSETHADVSVPNGNDGNIDVSVTGTAGIVTYMWSNGSTTEDVNALIAGTYTVTVTDANACTASLSIIITQPGCSLMVSAAGLNVTIPNGNDGEITLAVTGAFGLPDYIWNDGSTLSNRTGLSSGVYTVTVTDAGCSTSTSVLITSPACGLVVAENHTNVSIPNGSDGTIDVIVGGAFGAIQYLWNDGNTNEDRANLTAGTYIVTVTDAGNCSDILNILITMPACALSVAEAVTHVTVPNGNDGSVQLSVVLANGNVTYSWNDGSTLQNRTGLTAGTYTVTVTDSANCSDITTFSINQPACALILNESHIDVTIPNANDGSINIVVTGAFGSPSFIWNDGSTDQNRSGLVAGTYTVTVDDFGCTSSVSITISQPVCALVITQNHNNVTIPNGTDGSINVSYTGAYLPISFAWSDGFTSEDRSNLTAGVYTVIATDAGGCTYSKQITITQPTCGIVISETHTDVLIPNTNTGSIDVTVMGDFSPTSYLWSDGSTSDDRQNIAAGIYTLTVTDAGGCINDITISISQPACAISLVASQINVTHPFGSNGSIDITQTGGFLPVAYLWNDGNTNEDRNNIMSGIYTVTATDAGNCTAEVTLNVSEPACSIVISEIHSAITTPGGNDGSIDITVTGGYGQSTFIWSNGATTEDVSGLVAGTYTVTVTDSVGCISTSVITINQPGCSISLSETHTDVSIPNGSDGSISINVSGAFGAVDYIWNDGETLQNRNALIAGVYTVTATDASSCIATINIAIVDPPCALVLTQNHTDVSIPNGNDGSINITASGGYAPISYIWNDGSTLEDRNNIQAGVYTVVATDAGNCTASKQITITQPSCALVLSEVHTNVTIANGSDGSIDITQTGGYAPVTYLWDNGSTDEDRTGLIAGTYVVTVADAGGCSASLQVVISQPACNLSVTETHTDVTIPNGSDGSINLMVSDNIGACTFIWSNGNTNQNIAGLTSGTYSVTVTDSVGCATIISIAVNEPGCNLSITEAHNDVTIPNGSDGAIDVSIAGAFGLVQFVWNDGNTNEDRNNLAAGTYTLTVNDAGNCVALITVNIAQPTCILALTQNHTDVTTPNGNDGTINVTQTGGYQPVTYLWNDGNTNEDRNQLIAGVYTVTATDAGGCTADKRITIDQPACVLTASTVHNNVSMPGGNDGSIDVIVANNLGATTYLWNDGSTNEDRAALIADTYMVTVTDSTLCSIALTIEVTEPQCFIAATETHNNISIAGANDGSIDVTVTGAYGSAIYNWSDGNTNEDRSNLSPGLYTVIVTDSLSCTATLTIEITEIIDPMSLMVMATQVNCNGLVDSVWVNVSGGKPAFNYSWSNGSTSAYLTQVPSGITYQVTVTDFVGTVLTDSVETILYQPLGIQINNIQHAYCGIDSGIIDLQITGGNGILNYLWSDGATVLNRSALSGNTYTITITDSKGCNLTQSFIINSSTVLQVTLSQTAPIICNGAAQGQIESNVSGGSAPYLYIWSDGQITSTANSLIAGVHTVTVTDVNGCIATTSVSITEPTALIITESHIDVSAFGAADGSVDINVNGATAPYNYLWSDGSTTQDLNNLAAGTYTVTVTDANGCFDIRTIQILNPQCLLDATSSVTDASIHGASDGSISVNVVNNIGTVTFVWSNGATTQNLTAVPAGIYTVLVSDVAGCTTGQTAIVNQPNCDIQLSISTTDATMHGANDGSADLSISNAFGATLYDWSNGSTTEDQTALSAAVYTVTVTDAGGCTKQINAIINQPPCLIQVNETHADATLHGMADGSIDISVSGYFGNLQFAWSNGSTNEDVAGLSAGTYTVIVTDDGGCIDSVSVSINEPPCNILLSEMHFDASVYGASDGFIDLTVSNGVGFVTYNWSNGEFSEDIYNLSAGTYTVTVTDAGNCTASVSVVITEPSCSITLSETHSNPSIHGASDGSIDVTVTSANGTLNYSWNDGAFTEDRLSISAGTYTVTVTDGSGCSAELTIVLTDPACALSVAYTKTDVTTIGANDGTIDVTVNNAFGNIYYQWSDGNIFPDRTNLASGTYTLSVTDGGGCFGAITVVIGVSSNMNLTVTATDVLCNGDSTGTAQVFVNGGTIPYSYFWSNGATTATVTGLAKGVFKVTVTDFNGIVDSATVNVNQPVKLNGTKIITYASCYGNNDGAIDLSVIGGVPAFTYAWDNGETTQDINHLKAGLYKVVITDQNGCIDKLRARVKQPKKIRPSGEEVDVSCFGGNDGSVVYTIGGGVPPYTFMWNDGVTTKDRTNMHAGTYTLTITDAIGCVRVTEKTITQPAEIVVVCNPIPLTTACSNDGHIFTMVTGGANPYDYLWNDGATTANRHNLSAATYTVTVTDKKGCIVIQTVVVTAPDSIQIGGTVQAVNCTNPLSGSIQLAVNGGMAPYTYLWNNGATSDLLSNIGAGTYTVVVADENNCTVTQTFVLSAPAQPASSIASNNISCFGLTDGSALVAVTGGNLPYTYLWNTGNTTSNITGLSAATYTATVTDALGCTSVSNVIIVEPSKLIPLRNKTNVSCFGGNDGSVVWQTYGGTPLYSYVWSDGSTLSNRFNLPALLYDITVTDANGCSDTVSIKINQPQNAVNAQLTVINLSSACVNDGSITATGSGGVPPYSYLWSNGQTLATATGLSASLYTVTVSDFNGCSYQTSANVNGPSPMSVAASITGTCTGTSNGSVSLTVTSGMPAYTYLWNDGSTLQNRSNMAATTYTVTVTDAVGCTTSGVFDVTALPDPQITWLENNVTCNGNNNGMIDITDGVIGPYQYLWSNGITTQDVVNLAPGTYTVSVTNVLGCNAQFGFIITEPDVLDANKNKQNVSCNGGNDGTITINASGGTQPYSFVWSNGNTTASIFNLTANDYTVTITDANGCTLSNQTKINQPAPISIATVSTNCSSFGNNDGTATVSVNSGGVAPYSFMWSNGQTNALASQLISGTYIVTVTDANGCTATANAFVNEPAPICFGFVSGHVVTYFNPANGGDSLSNYLDNNFGVVFNDTLVLGCSTGYSLTFTSAQAVKDFLPTSGNPKSLAQSYINPDTLDLQNTLAAQLLALALNIKFDLSNPDFAPMSTVNFRDLTIVEPGPFYGYTVQQLYDEANSFIGGCGSINTGAQIRTMLSIVNSSWNLGSQTNGSLACPGAAAAKFEYGKTANDELNLNAYPNPNRGNFNLSYYAVNAEPVTIKIMDLTGHQIAHFASQSIEGYNKLHLTLGETPKGVYNIQFLINNQVRNLRLIVQ